jgi:hypothetical protein
LQGLLEEEGRIERAEQDAVKQRMLSEYAARLGLEALAVPDLASLIANLFTVFGKWGRTRTCTLCAFSTYTFG